MGKHYLTSAFNSNSALHTLKLANHSNNISHVSINAFIAMLRDVPTMNLELSGFEHYVTGEHKATIRKLLARNRRFTQLKEIAEGRKRLWNLGFMWGGASSALFAKAGLSTLGQVGESL